MRCGSIFGLPFSSTLSINDFGGNMHVFDIDNMHGHRCRQLLIFLAHRWHVAPCVKITIFPTQSEPTEKQRALVKYA
jgi:hypothetical protein